MERGWRQGVTLDPQPGGLVHEGADGFILLNQTCDCISNDLENEPCFEILPFTKLSENPDSLLINGRNARRIHFQLEENGALVWVSARMADIRLINRTAHESLDFSKRFSISTRLLEDLITWRANRYLRPAFPDDFEKALSKPLKKIGRILKENENLIDRLLIGLEPQAELEEGEKYEVHLKLMIAPFVYADSKNSTTLHQIAQEIESHLCKVEKFDTPTCMAQNLADMSLWERENFLDFSRYDYLSFGGEEDMPNREIF